MSTRKHIPNETYADKESFKLEMEVFQLARKIELFEQRKHNQFEVSFEDVKKIVGAKEAPSLPFQVSDSMKKMLLT